jgi:hypothetical protein
MDITTMLWTIAVSGYAHDGKTKVSYTKVSKVLQSLVKKELLVVILKLKTMSYLIIKKKKMKALSALTD